MVGVLFFIPQFLISQNYWAKTTNVPLKKQRKLTVGSAYLTLDQEKFEKEFYNKIAQKQPSQIALINEKGILEIFDLQEAPLLSEALAKKFHKLKNYTGKSTTRPDVKLRLSISPQGVNAWMRLPNQEDYFIQPVRNAKKLHFSYIKKGQNLNDSWQCKTLSPPKKSKTEYKKKLKRNLEMRTFRIAIATTAEYTTFWGDDDDSNGSNKEDALAAVVSTLNRVNEIYENEIQIHLELVTDTTLVYTDPMSDPFTNDLSEEIQETLDNEIGDDSYDVGHLFGYGTPNGDAGCVGCVCVSGRKGSAFSSHSFEDPFGAEYRNDYFDLDYFGHELGHQFGAYHTFAFQVEGFGYNAEPGSGTTIMGYAGISGNDDVQRHGDAYFHFYSLQNINEYVAELPCGSTSPITTTAPIANGGLDYFIPTGTAYELKAQTPLENESVTYCWEQLDSGGVTQDNFGPQNATGPQARSLPPSSDRSRFIPNMSQILKGNLTQTNPQLNQDWETVSDVGRLLRWGLTVRETQNNQTLLGQDEIEIEVVENSGPFQITSQRDRNIVWEAGTKQRILWDVGNTFEAPIGTETISIYLSENEGIAYSYLLLANTSNDGEADIIVPSSLDLSRARIKIEADNSIYFAINEAFIEVQSRDFVLSFDAFSQKICSSNEVEYDFEIKRFSGHDDAIALTINELPQGLSASFSKAVYGISDTRGKIVISGLQTLDPNDFDFEVLANSGSLSYDFQFDLALRSESIPSPELYYPNEGVLAANLTPNFRWSPSVNVDYYTLQVAEEANFQEIIQEIMVYDNEFNEIQLEEDKSYYWRVKGHNECGVGDFSEGNSFRTSLLSCVTLSASNVPSPIADATIDVPQTTVFTIPVGYDLPIEDVNVKIDVEHNWIEDLTLVLVAPDGTPVLLSRQLGGSNSNYEQTLFDSEASESIFGASAPFKGSFTPVESLKSFYGKSALGNWTLEVTDSYSEDSGTLNLFELEFCLLGITLPNSDEDSILDENDNCPEVANQDQSDIDNNGIGDACDVFSAKNITLSKNNVSCIGKFNGSISLSALAQFDYLASIKGSNNVDRVIRFSEDEDGTLTGLGAGLYEVCVTSDDFTSFEYCYDVQIREPEELEVQAVVQNSEQEVTVFLKGSDSYMINWNGRKYEVGASKEKINFPLTQKWNRLEVKTALRCQGSFETWIARESEVSVFPNPAQRSASVLLPERSKAENIRLFDTSGNLIWQKQIEKTNSPEVQVPVTHLSPGLYLILVKYPTYQTQLKLIKE